MNSNAIPNSRSQKQINNNKNELIASPEKNIKKSNSNNHNIININNINETNNNANNNNNINNSNKLHHSSVNESPSSSIPGIDQIKTNSGFYPDTDRFYRTEDSFLNFSSNFDNNNDDDSFIESNFNFISKIKNNKKNKNNFYYNNNLNLNEISPNKKYNKLNIPTFIEKFHIAYKGMDNDRGCEIIWNEIDISSLKNKTKEKLFNEILRLKNISKEDCLNSIIDCWKKETENNKTFIVFITECFGIGTLRDYLLKFDKQKLNVIKGWIITLLRSLIFLHNSNLFYIDLNSTRVLFNGNLGTIAIKDLFTASKIFQENLYVFEYNFLAPEIITKNESNEKSDIYSLGMLIIEIITLEIPYSECESDNEVINKKINGKFPSSFYRIMDENVKKFLMKLICFEVDKRLTANELLKDEFLKISKDDYRIIKVKSSKYRKKYKESFMLLNNDEKISFKNLLIFKDFKEKPYDNDEENEYLQKKKILNDIINNNSSNNNFMRKFNNININNNNNIKDEESDDENEDSFDDVEIFDDNYNISLKFMINENGKVSEIQFTYNLIKDNVESLMEEIKNEFNLNEQNLNYIYLSLKKVHIYSKFINKFNNILPNNSF